MELIEAITIYPLGVISDKIGNKRVLFWNIACQGLTHIIITVVSP